MNYKKLNDNINWTIISAEVNLPLNDRRLLKCCQARYTNHTNKRIIGVKAF